jgi:hypothetical protein
MGRAFCRVLVHYSKVATGIEPMYAVLQTAA